MTQRDALLILNATRGLTNHRIEKLLTRFISPIEVLKATFSELTQDQLIPAEAAQSLISFPKEQFLENEYKLVNNNNINIITIQDDNYPAHLKEIPDAPVVLYSKGVPIENLELAVAIVGSRRASLYGAMTAERLAGDLGEYGFVIVSGLARGIDTAAHRGALKAKAKTIAVLGCGFSHIYPPENERLFKEIAASGAIFSEFPMETPPIAYNFPRRNRIISGFSLGVIVVEASLKSGALGTSDFALEQGREVFAVPGKIDSPNSQGVHQLIRQGAKLVGSVHDVIEELSPRLKILLKSSTSELESIESNKDISFLSGDEKVVLERISKEAVYIDDLSEMCGYPVSRLSAMLLELELKRVVKQLPGKRFILNK